MTEQADLPQPQLRDLPLFDAGAELEAAHRAWKCNCGPTAIAAATGKSLDNVRAALTNGTGRFRGYTTVPDVQAALRWLDVRVERTWSKPPKDLLEVDLDGPAILMIQFGGPWMRDPRAAARHRHLIAFRYGWFGPTMGPRWVGDVTNRPAVWWLLDAWIATVHELMPDGGDGTWSIGWACQLAEAS